jgi:hypothetical protein
MGAITVSSRSYNTDGPKVEVDGALTLSSSYATDGDSYTAAQFGLRAVDTMLLSPTDGYAFQPDLTNLKIIARGPMAEAAPGTPLNGISVRYRVTGV